MSYDAMRLLRLLTDLMGADFNEGLYCVSNVLKNATVINHRF